MASAFIQLLHRTMRRRKTIRAAILEGYDLEPAGRVRRLAVAQEVAAKMGIRTVSPQFQVEVRQVAISLGARTVRKGNARFFRGLTPRGQERQG